MMLHLNKSSLSKHSVFKLCVNFVLTLRFPNAIYDGWFGTFVNKVLLKILTEEVSLAGIIEELHQVQMTY